MNARAVEFEAQLVAAEVGEAMERVLDAAEAALKLAPSDAVQAQLHRILEACAVGDLAAQRLARIGRLARGEGEGEGEDPLLNGPAGADGLDQAAADRLLAFD